MHHGQLLAAYLLKNKIKKIDFAKMIGRTRDTVHQMIGRARFRDSTIALLTEKGVLISGINTHVMDETELLKREVADLREKLAGRDKTIMLQEELLNLYRTKSNGIHTKEKVG